MPPYNAICAVCSFSASQLKLCIFSNHQFHDFSTETIRFMHATLCAQPLRMHTTFDELEKISECILEWTHHCISCKFVLDLLHSYFLINFISIREYIQKHCLRNTFKIELSLSEYWFICWRYVFL